MVSESMLWNSSEAVLSPQVAELGNLRPRKIRTSAMVWMAWDLFLVVLIAALSTLYRLHLRPGQALARLIHGTLIPGRSMGALLTYLAGFLAALVLISWRLNLYNPRQMHSLLHEQRLNFEACLGSGLLLAGALYLIHADGMPRSIVISTVLLVAVCVGIRRILYRISFRRSLRRGVGVRNVLIVGVGSGAQAVRRQLEREYYLGYRFRGFIQVPGDEPAPAVTQEEIVGDIDEIFGHARKRFVEEILLVAPSYREGMMAWLFDGARSHGIDLRVIPGAQDGLVWQNPIEYLGPMPTIPIHIKEIPEFGLLFKRSFDVVFSLAVLVLTSPLMALVALAIKLDSRGPVFYLSKRIGKRGRVFRCIKFRTMVEDADERLAEIAHLNERDSVLFKVANDPRITQLGRWLRKYSVDELPQFVNVLKGEMSVVGPRPPLGNEVKKYELDHLRRLEVTPGITGLWQVENRQDPSFESYVSLDVNYIDNWSPWLDFKIILRTIGVVFAGTGS